VPRSAQFSAGCTAIACIYGCSSTARSLGRRGDAMNVILAAAGHNLRIILRKLRFYRLYFIDQVLVFDLFENPEPVRT
jgi:hypothetical protein